MGPKTRRAIRAYERDHGYAGLTRLLALVDVGHSLKDQKSNRRSHLPGYAAWEIHPVMKLTVQ